MIVVTNVCFGILAVAGVLCIARAIRSTSSLADRIVALDALLLVFVGALAVLTARLGAGIFVHIIIVAALLGFVATVTVARYIERRGA